MLSFSKFAVISVLLAPSLVVSSAQAPAGHLKPVGIEKVMAQLTKVKEEGRPKMVALFESFVHEWASLGHLVLEHDRLWEYSPSDHFRIIGELKDKDMRGLQELLQARALGFQLSKGHLLRHMQVSMTPLLHEIQQHYALAEAGQPRGWSAEENLRERVVKELLGEPLKAKAARLSAAYLVLLESSTECLLGVCSDEGLKLLGDMTAVLGAIKKTFEEKLKDVAKIQTEMDAIKDTEMEALERRWADATNSDQQKQIEAEALPAFKAKWGPTFEKMLAVAEDKVKATEEFSQKVKNGTMVSSLEAQFDKKKSECTALAVGLGLGLGLGLPASFALVLFVLFKNGRLSWRSPLDSQA